MKKGIIKNQKGVMLIEMLVSIAVFSVAVILATSIFKSVIEGQRSAIAAQNTQESMRYALEVMSKEIRMAQKSEDTCDVILTINATDEVYNTDVNNEELYFKNKDGYCVAYYLDLDPNGVTRLKIDRWDGVNNISGYITPDEIDVSGLKFSVADNLINSPPGNKNQPRVTIKMEVEMAEGKAIHKQKMKIQTTVSARYY